MKMKTVEEIYKEQNPQDGTVPPWAKRLAEAYAAQFTEEESISDDFFTTWMGLWPSRQELKKRGISRVNDPVKCQSKLKEFIKNFYKHTGIRTSPSNKKEMILAATQKYINEFKSGKLEWDYINDSSNFINHAQRGSRLAIYINTPEDKTVNYKNLID